MKKTLALIVAAAVLAVLFAGCSSQSAGVTADTTAAKTDDEMFTDADREIGYSEADCETITLADDSSTSSSKYVTIDGNTVTITKEGYYIVSGSLSDGQLQVAVSDSEKVHIILNGASITNSSSAAIYIKTADKVFITTANGSENTLEVTGDYVAIDDNNIDAVIFSKSDVTLNGAGSLTVKADYGHAIVSKDDLKITSGTYDISAPKSAVDGKNSVRIGGGTISITSDKDAVHSEDEDDDTHGFIYVSDGDITIKSGTDGFDAMTTLTVVGGTFNIDAGDDGMHADGTTSISGGTINITNSYEGIEGHIINISGGTISVTSSDDGLNASGGNDQSGFKGPEAQSDTDTFATSSASGDTTTPELTISGGELTINASGDGIDSNGDLTITGGTITVYGPTDDGNGALDYGEQGTATISGGTLMCSGSSGMAESFSSDSSQCSILYGLDSSVSAGTTVTLKDSSGNTILSFTPEKTFNCLNLSSPDIKSGETYTLVVGSTEYTVEMSSTTFSSGNVGMGGGMGGNMGGGMAQGNMPSGGKGQMGGMPQGGSQQAPNA